MINLNISTNIFNEIYFPHLTDYNNRYEYSQFAKEIVDYVIGNGEFVLSKYGYDVYYIE